MIKNASKTGGFNKTPLIWGLLILFLLIFTSWSLIDNQDELLRGKQRTPAEYTVLQEGTESASGVQFSQRAVKKPMDDLTIALRDARKRGDTQEVQRIEKLFKSSSLNTGEAAGQQVSLPSKTVGFPGEPRTHQDANGSSLNPLDWGNDIKVRGPNTDLREDYPAVATSANGTIYCAWENVESGSDTYIQLYYSVDDGQTWTAFGFIQQAGADLTDPSIAIGEGLADTLLVAYIVDNGADIPHPEVSITPLVTPASWTAKSIPFIAGWEAYRKPVIWTDSYAFTGWFAYLTAEAIISAATNNLNVTFWRTTNYGATFSAQQTPLGNSDPDFWQDPDGAYTAFSDNIYVACFNGSDNNLYTLISGNYGVSWSDTVQIRPITTLPGNRVDPEIEAATVTDNVMLVCTKGSTSFGDDIGQTYSTDGGFTWTTLFTLEGFTSLSEFAVALNANEGGGSWHLAYTSNSHVFYSHRPQDLSGFWQSNPDIVDDAQFASQAYPKKGITSNWANDVPGVFWADFRDPTVGDYDIYSDYNGTTAVPVVGVTPGSFTFNLQSGGSTSDVLTINNTGTADLIWNLSEQNTTLVLENGQKLSATVEFTHPQIAQNPTSKFSEKKNLTDALLNPATEKSYDAQSNPPGERVFALGDIIKSFASPGTQSAGIVWDGSHLWVTERGTNSIHQIDSTNGTILSTIPNPNTTIIGLTFDGTYLWSTGYDNLINKINPVSGAVVQTLNSPTTSTNGLAFDGTDLWVSAFNDPVIYRIDASTGSVLGTIPAPGTASRGMVFDGENLWVADMNNQPNDMVHKLDPATGNILTSFYPNVDPATTFPIGIATDGIHLWMTDFQAGLVYKIDAGNELGCAWISENPISGVIPGGGNQMVNVLVDASGLSDGTYNCDLVVNSNDPATPTVNVPVTLTVTTATLPPQIGLSSTSFSFTVQQGSSDSDVLTLSNTAAAGAFDLVWVITEQNITEATGDNLVSPNLTPDKFAINISPVVNKQVPTSPDAVDLAKASGASANVELVPGYLPSPAFTESLIYYNGPLVNSPGTGAGGADESVLQSVSLSMNTLGFGHQVSAGNRIADDFVITASATIDSVVFFAYQTNSPTTSTITAVNLRIWDGPPDNPASNVVFGDTLTNRLMNTTWSGIYRVTETLGGSTARPLMKNTVLVGTVLPPGTYWLDWQSDGSLASGPWAPPITINGQNTTGNGYQYTGAWAPVQDTGSLTPQGFPFWLYGDGGGDCPWLEKSPESGSIAAGGNQNVQISVNTAGLAVGTYNCNLICNSNDPANPQATVSVQLQVTPVVGITDPKNTVITQYDLLQNYPNPFNPTTTIRYQLANTQPQQTRVQLFNSAGQLIRILVNEIQDNGQYQVVWDGLNDLGQESSSGVYFYQITSGSFQTTKKLVKLK